ncbi:MAG: ribose 5-phosphate isomerase B [candidate division NC10 bacterium]|jgi:ribose 5-phosphate isomerase B|nr:ribose 5-phosphate isomerase B [candidate division NC10 bacterium]MCH7897066.1 ribose 5-phosphate isomerase B [candidate division NC10 bacterium]MCZ6550568.1 ribose 5-phosphate isomerase B [candidate division NC10 bacterium]
MKPERLAAIGADHAAYHMKEELKPFLKELGYPCLDFGTHSADAVDYPDIVFSVAKAVVTGQASCGIVLCGTGIGSAIVANKVPGARASLCHDTFSAKYARAHNDANVLAMGARVIGMGLAREIVREWLAGKFEGGRHSRRVGKIERLEEQLFTPEARVGSTLPPGAKDNEPQESQGG